MTMKKSAFITGSSKGIGYAVAAALHGAGYAVTITSRHENEAKEAAQTLGEGARGVQCDVRDPEALEQAINAHVSTFGGLDVLFVNAGVGAFGNFLELSIEDWQRVIDTNLSGAFYTVRAGVPHIKEGGYVFTLSSLAAVNAFAGGAAYNASKFGLNGLSEVLMLELRERGIKFTQLMPGSVSTHFNGHTPTEADAWKIQPEDIAQLTIDLLEMPERTLPSRVEIRPSQPKKK